MIFSSFTTDIDDEDDDGGGDEDEDNEDYCNDGVIRLPETSGLVKLTRRGSALSGSAH